MLRAKFAPIAFVAVCVALVLYFAYVRRPTVMYEDEIAFVVKYKAELKDISLLGKCTAGWQDIEKTLGMTDEETNYFLETRGVVVERSRSRCFLELSHGFDDWSSYDIDRECWIFDIDQLNKDECTRI